MDEKVLFEEERIITTRSPSPPSYDHDVHHNPPPPTYLQSTVRLYYKNQPFISDCDVLTYRQEQEQQRQDDQSDTWSEIAKLPLHRCFNYYITSWCNTVCDGRLIFFAFFIFASLTIMSVVIAVIVLPSLLSKH